MSRTFPLRVNEMLLLLLLLFFVTHLARQQQHCGVSTINGTQS